MAPDSSRNAMPGTPAGGAGLARQRVQQIGERHFAFAGDDDVGAGVEVFAR
jgi:hypothetical protein